MEGIVSDYINGVNIVSVGYWVGIDIVFDDYVGIEDDKVEDEEGGDAIAGVEVHQVEDTCLAIVIPLCLHVPLIQQS